MSLDDFYYEAAKRAAKSPFHKPYRIIFFMSIAFGLPAIFGELYSKTNPMSPMTMVSIHTLRFLHELLLFGAFFFLLRSYGKLVAIKWKLLYIVICFALVINTYVNTLLDMR